MTYPERWSIAYLGAQARGYRHRNASLASVQGAVKMANHCRVPADEIAAVLRESGLQYEPETQTVSDPLAAWS